MAQAEADLQAKYALEMQLRVQLETAAAEHATLAQEIQDAHAATEREAEARSKVEAELAEQVDAAVTHCCGVVVRACFLLGDTVTHCCV